MRVALALAILPVWVTASAIGATKSSAKTGAKAAPTPKASGKKSPPSKGSSKSKAKADAAPAAVASAQAPGESESSEWMKWMDSTERPLAHVTPPAATAAADIPPPPPTPAAPPATPEPSTPAPSTPEPRPISQAAGRGGQRQGEWTLYRLEGRDYVTMENVAEFYGMGALKRSSANGFGCGLGQRRFRGASNSKEFFINDLKFILSYPILEHQGHPCVSRMDLTKLIEPVMRPSRIKGAEIVRTVVLDAGHGGHDNGAWSPYGHEKQFSLDVVYRAKKLLEMQGYRVVLTRSNDTFVSLYDRARIANAQQNAIFISVHFNSGGAGTGLETYTLAPRGVPSMMADGPSVNDLVQCAGNINDAQNTALATATHAAQVVRSKLFDRGIKRARFVVLRETTIPAVLIEGGFLTNSYDARVVAMPEYRQMMATSIVTAVNNYRRAVGASTEAIAQRPPGAEPQVRLNSTGRSPQTQTN